METRSPILRVADTSLDTSMMVTEHPILARLSADDGLGGDPRPAMPPHLVFDDPETGPGLGPNSSRGGAPPDVMDIEGDTDVETESDVPSSAGDETLSLYGVHLPVAHLSGLLGHRTEADRSDDERSLTVYRGDLPGYTAPGPDPYGWEAELGKKTCLAVPGSSTAAPTPGWRRADGVRGHILRRILNRRARRGEPS
jgi:hypothetical protein